MAKRSYSDEDRARVYSYLTANDGIVSRTSADTGVPEQTVREWKKKWEEGGLPARVEAALPAVQGDISAQFSSIRDMALERIQELIPQTDAKHLNALNNIWGTLQDKIDRMNGVANKLVEVKSTVTHQTSEQAAEILRALADNTLSAVDARYEIIDVEVEEQPLVGLPVKTDTKE